MIEVEALENVLLEILEIRKSYIAPSEIKIIKASEWMNKPVPSRQESAVKSLANPDRCREEMAILALYWLGERLNKCGGSDLMEKACYEVAARHPAREGYMLDICSKRWDGIGDWHA